MGNAQIIGATAAFLLFISFIVGLGASQYVEYEDTSISPNVTAEELDVPLNSYNDTRYTYYDASDTSIKVNVTEWENRGFFDPDIPNVQYIADIPSVETIVVEIRLPEDHDGGMFFGQGASVRPLYNGTNRMENLRTDDGQFRVRWEPEGSNDSTLNGTVENIELSTEEAPTSGFIGNIQRLVSVSTGYPFFNEVILGIIGIVLGYIALRIGAEAIPL